MENQKHITHDKFIFQSFLNAKIMQSKHIFIKDLQLVV